LNHLGHRLTAKIPTSYRAALIIALLLSIMWWGVALLLRNLDLGIVIWHDQQWLHTPAGMSVSDPYQIPGYVYPPWAALLLVPLQLLPLPLTVLWQQCLYFATITTIIYKFGGDTRTVLLVLLSFVALMATLELSIDWIVCLALLVPPEYSGPFMAVKPQLVAGYWLTFNRRQFVRALLVLLSLVVVSLLIWQGWPLKMWNAIQVYSLGRSFNIAPMVLIPWPIAIGLGVIVCWRAFKRRDPILAILGWPFFVPYLTFYALLVHFALLAVRYPRIALLISGIMWLIMGGFVGAAILATLMAR